MGMNTEEMPLRAVLSWEKISSAVLGVNRTQQLQENLKFVRSSALTPSTIKKINTLISQLPEKILTPHLWDK